jgi:hypothetical protein
VQIARGRCSEPRIRRRRIVVRGRCRCTAGSRNRLARQIIPDCCACAVVVLDRVSVRVGRVDRIIVDIRTGSILGTDACTGKARGTCIGDHVIADHATSMGRGGAVAQADASIAVENQVID